MMRRAIAIAALTGAFAMTGCSADQSSTGPESLFVEMSDVEGSDRGALTVRANNVRFDKLATAVLNTLMKHERSKHPDMPEVSFDFEADVAKRIVSLTLENERSGGSIQDALLKVGECRAIVSKRDGKEHITFSTKQAQSDKQTANSSPAKDSTPAGEPITVDEDSPEYQAMLKTWRAFRECTNKGDYEGAKAFVRLEGNETDPNKSWSEGQWKIQALVLEHRGKVDISRLKVSSASINNGPLKRGLLRIITYYEGRERGASAGIDFVFIDGKAYITKL